MCRLFTLQALLLLVIGILYFYFGLHERYVFTIVWWDVLLHVLGGAWVALISAWAFSMIGKQLGMMQCILLALLVGGAWEIFEYVFGIGGSNFMSYQVDTAKDLIDDAIGGTLAALLIKRL